MIEPYHIDTAGRSTRLPLRKVWPWLPKKYAQRMSDAEVRERRRRSIRYLFKGPEPEYLPGMRVDDAGNVGADPRCWVRFTTPTGERLTIDARAWKGRRPRLSKGAARG